MLGCSVSSCLLRQKAAKLFHKKLKGVICLGQQSQYSVHSEEKIPEVILDEGKAPQSTGNRHIPITRRTLIQKILQHQSLLTSDEKMKFEQFASGLDSEIYKGFRPELLFLKKKYDILNPDRSHKWASDPREKERSQSEFLLMRRLSLIMKRAHFTRLSDEEIVLALNEHDQEGVMVSVDPTEYETLAFWVLGKEKSTDTEGNVFKKWGKGVKKKISGKPSRAKPDNYRRVVVVMRLRKNKFLYLKAFKDVPVDCLEQLLPNGKILMTKWDTYTLWSSVVLGGVSLATRGLSAVGEGTVFNYSMVFAAVTGILVYRAVSNYLNKRNSYLLKISRMLYYKNIANNRGLITLLVDQAEDAVFKEALLVYIALLINRIPLDVAAASGEDISSSEPVTSHAATPVLERTPSSPLPLEELDGRVKKLLSTLSLNRQIDFESDSCLKLLQSLGLVRELLGEEGSLSVQATPLTEALQLLPKTEVIIEHAEEFQMELDKVQERVKWDREIEQDYAFYRQTRAWVNQRIKVGVTKIKEWVKTDLDDDKFWGKEKLGLYPFLTDKLTRLKQRYRKWNSKNN